MTFSQLNEFNTADCLQALSTPAPPKGLIAKATTDIKKEETADGTLPVLIPP